MRFALALHSDDGRHYGVTVPDLPGCFSAGDSIDEAIEQAAEAIDGHCELLAEDGKELAAPKSLAEHQANPDLAGAVWAFVEVATERYFGPAQKINITVPASTLRRIDDYARRHHLSRSGFLVEAANRVIAEEARAG